MIAAFVLALAASGSGADWRQFDLRQHGVGASPTYFDGASLERRSDGRLRVSIASTVLLSGLPDRRSRERLEIDCRRGLSRRIRGVIEAVPPSGGFRRVLRGTRFAPIAPDSLEGALALMVCAPAAE